MDMTGHMKSIYRVTVDLEVELEPTMLSEVVVAGDAEKALNVATRDVDRELFHESHCVKVERLFGLHELSGSDEDLVAMSKYLLSLKDNTQ